MLKGRERWFAEVLQAGLETRVLEAPEILLHVTPAVLAKSMPRDVLIRMFDTALTTGTISPTAIVETVTPDLLAEHVPATLVWESIVAAAERADILKGTDGKPARDFLRRAIDAALDSGVLTAPQLVRHVDPKVLVNHLPDVLTASLIEMSLAAGRMNPELIVDTVGVDAIAAHAPTDVVWACLSELGTSLVADVKEKVEPKVVIPPATTAKPKMTLDYMDESVVSLSVEVDEEDFGSLDSGPPTKELKPAGKPKSKPADAS
jgi:hypothetical protein